MPNPAALIRRGFAIVHQSTEEEKMRKFKILLLVATLLVAAAALTGCTDEYYTSTEADVASTTRVAASLAER